MPQGPPPHRSLLSVRSHSKGARVPSGVFASLQGLLWPDFSGPHNSLRSPRGTACRGALEASRKLEGFTKNPCSSWGRLREDRLRKQQGPAAGQPFFGEDRALPKHTPMHAPCASSTTSRPSGTAPRDHSTIKHIQGTHALSHTQFSQAHRRAHTYVVRTHRAGIGESLGCEAGRLLCCSCPRSGKG